MATATMHDGRAIVAYNQQGKAVDSEGVVIPGAPRPPKDTDPAQQVGASGAPTPEERMAIAIAQAIVNPKALAAKGAASSKAAEEPDGGEEVETPTLAELPDHLAGLKSVADVKAMQKGDERVGAQKLYAARIAELEGGE